LKELLKLKAPCVKIQKPHFGMKIIGKKKENEFLDHLKILQKSLDLAVMVTYFLKVHFFHKYKCLDLGKICVFEGV